jgi:hypothetical protein
MGVQKLLADYAIESGLIEDTTNVIINQEHLDELPADVVAYEKLEGDLSQASAAMESIQLLSDGFFGKSADITVESARLFHLSVESVLVAARIHLPASLVAPSFESVEQYSTEAEEKKVGILKRIWAWIVKVMKALTGAIRNIFTKTKTSFANVEKNLDKMKEMVRRIRGDKVKLKETSFIDNTAYTFAAVDDEYRTVATMAKDIQALSHFYTELGSMIAKVVAYKGDAKTTTDVMKAAGIQPGRKKLFSDWELTLEKDGGWEVDENRKKSNGKTRTTLTLDEIDAIIANVEKMISVSEKDTESLVKALEDRERKLDEDHKKHQEAWDKLNPEDPDKEAMNKRFDEWMAFAPDMSTKVAVQLGGGVNQSLYSVNAYTHDFLRLLQVNISCYKVKGEVKDADA